MFERRLKIFLGVLGLLTFVLVLRAAHVQVLQKEEWRAKALETVKRSRPVETVRGDLLDVKGRVIATDEPCIDACVDFRAMARPADQKEEKAKHQWLEGVATERLRNRLRGEYTDAPKSRRKEMLAAETARVKADIDSMWGRLAAISGRPLEQVEAARDEVVKKVNMRRRYVWYRNYELAKKKYEQREPAPAWRRWLIDESAQAPTPEEFTTLKVAEEESARSSGTSAARCRTSCASASRTTPAWC
jgi:cell division protein FtsI/penicillin-binding protein 2